MNKTKFTHILLFVLFLQISSIKCTEEYNRPSRGVASQNPQPSLAQNKPTNDDSECQNYTSEDSNLETRSSRNDRNSLRLVNDDDSLFFPTDTKTADCTHGLCVNVADYPKEHIKRLLKQSKFSKTFFNVTEEVVKLDNRFNSKELSLCETRVQTIYPEKAKNLRKSDKIIVNLDGHKQGIVFETCVENGACKFSSNFPTGYTSFCQQKFINKKLMVLGDGGEDFVFDSFEVPSCCVCMVKQD